MTTRTARVVRWLVRRIPEPILASPERVFLNFACVVIGVGALLGAKPEPLVLLWPWWVSYEWGAAMLLGGGFALIGYWREKRTLARFGYLLIGVGAVFFAVCAFVVSGWGGLRVGALFVGMAAAKAVRLLVGSAIRNAILEAGRDRYRP